MTIGEVLDVIEAFGKQMEYEQKIKIAITDFSARRHVEYLGQIFDSKADVTPLKELYPRFFDPNYVELTQEEQQKLDKKWDEVARFLQKIENDQKRKEVKKFE